LRAAMEITNGFLMQLMARRHWLDFPGSLCRLTFFLMYSWVVHSGIRSVASRFFGSSRNRCFALLLVVVVQVPQALFAQLTTGSVSGTVRSIKGLPIADLPIVFTGGVSFRTVIHSNSKGEFFVTLPYGRYSLLGNGQDAPSALVFVAPLQTVRCDLVMESSGALLVAHAAAEAFGIWTDDTRGTLYPEPFSLPGLLLNRESATVTQPLDFAGLSDNRFIVTSQRGISWTDTQYKLNGMDATDSYQPGLLVILPDVQALNEVVVRSGFTQTTSSSAGTEVGLFLAEPGPTWHFALSTIDTGASLSSTNLPAIPDRGLVQQPDQFRWLTQDGLEIGGPITKWADLYASARGQWASQTEPLATLGTDQHSRLLFANTRGRLRATDKDQIDALYSGSRVDLSDGGVPSGLEALMGNRLAPSFVLPGGFPGQPETDHLDFLQVGWIHKQAVTSPLNLIEVRYGYSVAHLDTSTLPAGQSRIELLGGTISGAPPLGNMAVRTRQGIEATAHPAGLIAAGTHHHFVAGGGWKTSEARNRFIVPSNMNLITAAGLPAFVEEFNTPLDSRELVRSLSSFIADHVDVTRSLALDVAAFADFSRGSLPNQSSPAGAFAPARTFTAKPDLIVWNNLSPRAGFSWEAPHPHALVLRGTYFRVYDPLAARYLDFGNPNSLGGSVYQWTATSAASSFQPSQVGSLLLRFGGPYSSISSTLRRPHSDEFDVGAKVSLNQSSSASIQLFRRDNKNRIAAIDTGVPPQAFTPASILDPGPDGIPGTFDDQQLTVYAQNPATLGHDRYLLTNPAGLRTLDSGLLAEVRTQLRRLLFHASFLAEKSYGPNNPGDTVYENDPGVIGALFLDPNTAIHAPGRSFVDRAYVGKIQASYQMPSTFGGVELASVADYMDGLAFARQLLITGLPQGPFLVATTVRGSPEGGNRAQYVINWSVRLSRAFRFSASRVLVSADVLNVTNAAQRLQESDLSGTSFNMRLPVAIQPSRQVRIGFRYEF
jgi:hypothetical protein